MKTITIDGIRFVVGDKFEGTVLIQSSAATTTMDGLTSISVDAESIVKLVSQLYVKPALLQRIQELPDREVLVGTV